MTVAIVTDSAAALPPELAARNDVVVVPMWLTVRGRAELEGTRGLEELVAEEQVTTSAPTPGEFEHAIKDALRGNDGVVVLTIAGSMSATYQAAVKQRFLEEQTLDAEQKKLNLGASTTFNVILVQRDLATAQSAEVSALSNYSKARVQLDFATAQTLTNNNISIAEAFQGQLSRPPSPLPAQP